MRVIATAPDTGRRWKLEPFDNGLCYQLFVEPMKGAINPRTGEAVKAEWTFTGKYPVSLSQGIKMMVDGMLADPNGTATIECDPKYLTKTVKKTIGDYVDKVIQSVEIDMAEQETKAVSALIDAITEEGE